MKTIDTNQLLNEPPELHAGGNADFGGERAISVDSDLVLQLTDEHTGQIGAAMAAGLDGFGALEATRAMQLVGRPTLIARVDCTLDPTTGEIHPYEVEERPAGMGLVDMLHQGIVGQPFGKHLLAHLEHTLGTLPVVKRHPNAKENDDGLLLPVEVFTNTKLSVKSRSVLVRSEPEDMSDHPQLAEATAHAIAPILEKGKRQYRLATGFAQLLTDGSLLPAESCVIKTLQGSKAKGVKIHLSKQDAAERGDRDAATRRKITEMVTTEGAVLLEPFVPSIPVRTESDRMANMILRVFGLVSSESVTVVGGAYMARPGHLVHGSKDAITGVILAAGAED